MNEWQPIETAPKDERVIINCSFGVCTAINTKDCWMMDPIGEYAVEGELTKVSHWMSLPKGPDER